jgi:general secretion pathway protein B
MSYILDALKRAERERRQGQHSALDELPPPPAGPGGLPRWMLPSAIAAVVAAALSYGVFVWTHKTAQPAAPAAETERAAAPLPATAYEAAPPMPAPPDADSAPPPSAPAVRQASAPPAPDQTTVGAQAAEPAQQDEGQEEPLEEDAGMIEDGDRIATLDDVVAPPPPQRTPPPASTPAAVPETGAELPPAAIDRRLAPGHRPPPAPQSPATDLANAPAAASSAAPGSAEAAPAGPTQSLPTQSLREMPAEFRAEFPALTVDVHAYNEDPARRFVIINGKRYREGDALAEGPRVVSIIAEGIVFDWHSERVLYALGR